MNIRHCATVGVIVGGMLAVGACGGDDAAPATSSQSPTSAPSLRPVTPPSSTEPDPTSSVTITTEPDSPEPTYIDPDSGGQTVTLPPISLPPFTLPSIPPTITLPPVTDIPVPDVPVPDVPAPDVPGFTPPAIPGL